MSLTLTVTSEQKAALGDQRARTFERDGGTLGRARGNAWVLPDPERVISSRHAVVNYQDGSYFLTDTSANGTYLNGAAEPIGNGNRVMLNDGDRLVIGDYEIQVQVREPEGLSVPPPAAGGTFDAFLTGGGAGTLPDDEDTLDPLALLDDAGSGGTLPGEDPWGAQTESDAAGGSSVPDDVPSPASAFTPPPAKAELIPDDWDLSDEDLLPSGVSSGARQPAAPAVSPPAPEAPPPVPPPSAPPPVAAPQTPAVAAPQAPAPPAAVPRGPAGSGFETFVRAAGLAPEELEGTDPDAFMELVGSLFRQMVADLREVLIARASVKSGFRMELTMIRPSENNPLKFSAGGVDEALHKLLVQPGKGYLPPHRALAEGFQDIKDHQVATMTGMQAAFKALLERFDPEKLEERFEKTGGWALLGVQKRADFWERFVRHFEEIKEKSLEDFQDLFGAEFARAYQRQLHELQSARARNVDE